MSELLNIEINNKEIIDTILSNISKLFINRQYIDETYKIPNDIIKEIHLNKTAELILNDKKISINILMYEIKSITSNSSIDEYLRKNTDTLKFIIAKGFTKKTYKQINDEYSNAEIFEISDFLEDIPSKYFIPIHKLVIGKELEELLQSFNPKEFGKIHMTDKMSRYYGGKIGDIFRIERFNINSGISVYYRVVIQSNLDIFN